MRGECCTYMYVERKVFGKQSNYIWGDIEISRSFSQTCPLQSQITGWLVLKYQVKFSFCQVGLKSSQTAIGNSKKMVIIPTNHCCGSQTLQQTRTIYCSPPQATPKTPSDNMNASPQGGKAPSNPGRQPRAMTIAHIVLAVLGLPCPTAPNKTSHP